MCTLVKFGDQNSILENQRTWELCLENWGKNHECLFIIMCHFGDLCYKFYLSCDINKNSLGIFSSWYISYILGKIQFESKVCLDMYMSICLGMISCWRFEYFILEMPSVGSILHSGTNFPIV